MLKQILLISSFLIAISLQAQDFTKAEIEQGYALKDQTTWFIFNAKSYKIQPKKVVVTGSFRGWSQDMNDPKWILKNTSKSSNLSVACMRFKIAVRSVSINRPSSTSIFNKVSE